MGNICLAAKAFFDALQIPCVVPLHNNKKTLKTGAYLSPEEICLPFKIMMGNYIDCLERGADTILITGSCGPCRFGEYCELQMNLLKKFGYSADMIVLDAPFDIGKEAFWQRLRSVTKGSRAGRAKKLDALRKAIQILKLADQIDASANARAGYEASRGECKRLRAEAKAHALSTSSPHEMRHTLLTCLDRLRSIRLDPTRRPVHITLVGEIYTMIEPFSNLYIEEKLMDLGACSIRPLTPSWWIKDLLLKPLGINSLRIRSDAKKYLPAGAGGHAKETIAHVAQAARAKSDGVIQVFPLGCMPEIVTKAVLPAIQKQMGIPVMTLVVDEVTGEAGYLTRIEAFLDMLEAKKHKGKKHA